MSFMPLSTFLEDSTRSDLSDSDSTLSFLDMPILWRRFFLARGSPLSSLVEEKEDVLAPAPPSVEEEVVVAPATPKVFAVPSRS